jgi:hypothetical protein
VDSHVRRTIGKCTFLGSVAVALAFAGAIGPQTARAADQWWDTGTTNVYTIYPYASEYTSKYPNTTLSSITSQLDTYRSQGFNALMFQPLNAGDGTIPFFGLAHLKQTEIAPSVGSISDYQAMLSAAHSRGMKILLFYNFGFASRNADFFQKACTDFRQGVASVERRWFIFANSPTASKPDDWHWAQCGPNAYYLWFWDQNAPAYDWSSPTWRNRVKDIVRFWMDLGTDGMTLDAPLRYYGGTPSYINEFVTDVLNSYDAPLGYAEGIGADTNLISNWHFPAVEDYEFSAQWARPTPVANAIANTHDPSGLEPILNAYRDRAVAAGGILWSPLEWGRLGSAPVLNPEQRALEAATVASVGALLDWHDTQDVPVFDFWNSWTAGQRQKVFDIQKAGRDNPALGAGGERLKLPTSNSSAYAFKRTSKDGTKAALVVLNFSASQQTITVDLNGSGIGPQTPTDLINGGNAAAITTSSYTVTLPRYGYTFLGLPQSQGSGGVLRGGSANTSASTNLSAEGTDDWAHWGHGGAAAFNHKSGVTQKISNYTALGTGGVQGFTGNSVTYSWTGGTPTANASNTDAAVFKPGAGSGFRLKVPADTTQRRLKLYVGGWQAYVRVDASLTDGSSLPYTDHFESGATFTNKVYSLDYKAGSANQWLIIDATVNAVHDPWGNVTLQGATLATPSLGLSATSANTVASTTLSSEGTDDWAHWGNNAVGDFNHKSAVTQKISNYTKIGSGTVQRFTQNPAKYSWSGGTPTGSASNTDAAVFIPGSGNGFRITAPADTTRRMLRLYVGGWQAQVRVHAFLSDGSSPAFTELFDSGGTTVNKVFVLSYRAGSAGQTLTVEATVNAVHDPWGNVTLQAATLSTPATGGALSGGSAHTAVSTHLSNQISDDWAHWGRNVVGDFNHKSGVTQKISNYTRIGADGTIARYANQVTYSWAGGTPTASVTETPGGIYIEGTGKGFRVTVPASTSLKTLKLFVGGWQAYCRLRAYLSDGSAVDYTDYYDSSGTTTNKAYTLTFKAGSAGQSLIVDVTVDTLRAANGNVTLQAATLTD